MKDYGQFHDGSFDGLWVDESTARFLLSTEEKERFTAVATGVVRLIVEGFRKGNTIFDVSTHDHGELTLDEISEAYEVREDASGKALATRLLAEARQHDLMILQIGASYGATCLALVRSVELLPRAEWVRRYFAATT